MSEEELVIQLTQLQTRLAQLEERVAQLENRPAASTPVRSSTVTSSAPTDADASASPVEGLLDGIAQALTQLGEADAGAVRQQMVKNGFPAALGRSDVNKALYANKDRFEVARQDGAKPFWRVAGSA